MSNDPPSIKCATYGRSWAVRHTQADYGTNIDMTWLWQRSCYDHICRQGETAETVLDYILNDPVRAGLVSRVDDWPWSKVFIEY